jgi:hypothetical protein
MPNEPRISGEIILNLPEATTLKKVSNTILPPGAVQIGPGVWFYSIEPPRKSAVLSPDEADWLRRRNEQLAEDRDPLGGARVGTTKRS